MRVCFFGVGSIGCRHISNLKEIADEKRIPLEIDVFRHASGLLPESIQDKISDQYFSYDELPQKYDAIFITNPTYKHFETLSKVKALTRNVFLEKPAFERYDYSIGEFERLNVYVACPLRYTQVIQQLRKTLSDQKVYAARIICSSFLPEWRPNSDYRKSYSASASQGGGVEVDLIHEWDYIRFIFGMPKAIKMFSGKFSTLEIDSNDVGMYIADYGDKLVSLHIDYVGRVPKRELEIYTPEEVICADLIGGKLTFLKEKKVIECREERNEYQKKELEQFLNQLDGTASNPNTLKYAIGTLKLTQGVVEE